MRKVILILVALTVSYGCAERINQVMSSWDGHHFSDLIEKWGPPSQIFDDGNEGRIFNYDLDRSYVTPGTSNTYTSESANIYGNSIFGSSNSYTTFTPSQIYSYKSYRIFWINRDGYVYRWAWKGL
jgi:hypothetical protein